MKPVVFGGHERPIKDIIFNKDDDFLYVASVDRYISLWSTETTERIGTFKHEAAVNSLRTSKDTKYLVSGDANGEIYIWDSYNGELIVKVLSDEPSATNSIDFGISNNQIVATFSQRIKSNKSKIFIFNIEDAIKKSSNKSVNFLTLQPSMFKSETDSKISITKFLNCNKEVLCAHDNGLIERRSIDGKVLSSNLLHSKAIMDLCLTNKEELALSSGKDGKSVLFDPETLEVLNEFKPENPLRNINSGKISPFFNPDLEDKDQLRHCIIGGGQDSKNVTFTSAAEGGFEMLIYEMITGDELGCIGGHFSPINAIALSNNGRIVVSGAEEGNVRLHVLQEDYYELKEY